MHRSRHIKPDGRLLWCYSRRPLDAMAGQPAPSPDPAPVAVNAHLRWHPVVGEWVAYASHRQDRTFLPPADLDPLAPQVDPARPTELPAGDYDVAVFQNRFPTLTLSPLPPPAIDGGVTARAHGACEVIVFSQDPITPLGDLGADYIALILQVLADRTAEMAAAGLRYVLPFENRGVEMGVTLTHPHGQIYGYGFVPAMQSRALAAMRRHFEAAERPLIAEISERERRAGVRTVAERDHAVAFVPPFARFPYEVWAAPHDGPAYLQDLSPAQRLDLAAVLSDALRRLDRLFARPMPYLLTVNQAPTDGEAHPEWVVYVAIWPLRRHADRLKYLAGTELAAGVFAGDILPEAAAAALRGIRL
jgi:UDPglucose--hexose-1-phosphate uridylyltransferase